MDTVTATEQVQDIDKVAAQQVQAMDTVTAAQQIHNLVTVTAILFLLYC